MDRQKRAGRQTHSRVSLGVFAYLSKHEGAVLARKNACSMRHAKDSAYLVAKGYIKIIKDTLGIDEEDENDALDKMKKDKELVKDTKQEKDSSNKKPVLKPEAVLPNEKKKPEPKDTVRN